MNEKKYSFGMGIALIWFAHLLVDFMIGVWAVYKTIVQLDLVIAGLIISFGIFIGEGFQLYFGYLSDKGYRQKLLAGGLGLTATIPFLCYVENEWMLFLLILSAFVGSGAFHPSGAGLVLGTPSTRKSSLIALFSCGGMVGAALSQVLYAFFYYRCEGNTWFLVLPVLVCAFGCFLFPFSKGEESVKKVQFKQVLQDLKPFRYQLGLLYFVHLALQIVVMSFAFLLPDILQFKGYESWFCLGGGYFCFIMGSVLTSIPMGYCVDKIGYRLVLASIVVASAILLYLFLGLETLSLTSPICVLALLGGTMGVLIPVVVAGGTQNVPSYTRSFVSALYMGGTICFAGFGPILASLLASYFESPVMALQILSSLFVVSIPLIYALPDAVSVVQEPLPVRIVNHSSRGEN